MARRPLEFMLVACAAAVFSAALFAQDNIEPATNVSAKIELQRVLDLQAGGTELVGDVSAPLVVNYTLVNGLDASGATVASTVNCNVALEPSLDGAGLKVAITPEAEGAFSFTLQVPGDQGETQEVPVTGVMLLHSEFCHYDAFGDWHCHDHHHHCSASENCGPWLLLSSLAVAMLLAVRRWPA